MRRAPALSSFHCAVYRAPHTISYEVIYTTAGLFMKNFHSSKSGLILDSSNKHKSLGINTAAELAAFADVWHKICIVNFFIVVVSASFIFFQGATLRDRTEPQRNRLVCGASNLYISRLDGIISYQIQKLHEFRFLKISACDLPGGVFLPAYPETE